MKKILLLGAVITAFTFTTFAATSLLSPRALGNAPKVAATSDASVVSVNAPVTGSPRVIGNAIKTSAGTNVSGSSAKTCSKMPGSPKMVAEYASHPGVPMPCCAMK
ncbi:MAG: hypothetical protein WDM80_12375 [Limisphaerales bacterium]